MVTHGRRYPATLFRGRGPDCNVGAATLLRDCKCGVFSCYENHSRNECSDFPLRLYVGATTRHPHELYHLFARMAKGRK